MTDSLYDLEIKGDKTTTHRVVEQGDPIELYTAFKELLAVPGVKSFTFSAYTPYFNDGEPCVYGVNGDLSYRLDSELSEYGGEDPEDPYDWYDYGPGGYSRGAEKIWRDDRLRVIYEAGQKVGNLLYSGKFNQLCQEKFGDHVCVTVSNDGIELEEYDHE